MRLARCFRIGLSKNTHDFCFEFREFDPKDGTAWMKDQVASRGEQIDMAAQHFAHAALDAIALVGFPEHFACSQSNTRPGNGFCLWRNKPAHRGRLAFATCGIHTLIVGVLAQTCTCE